MYRNGISIYYTLSVLGMTVVGWVLPSAAIDGIAISQYATREVNRKASRVSWGWNYGKIYRFDVRDSKVSPGTAIWDEFNAHCPRISPSGTRVVFNTSTYICKDPRKPAPDPQCKGDILVIPIGGGQPRTLVQGIDCLIWLDWPMEEYVYYQSDYEGTKLYRVNTTGTSNPELVASNFNGINPEGGARYWSMSSDGKRVGGWFGGSVQAGTIQDNKTITWKNLWGGCGGSLSPDGKVLTRNGGGHNTMFYHGFEGGILTKDLTPFSGSANDAPPVWSTSMCSGAGSNWHRMHWPVNSSEWVLVTMGDGYQIENSAHPVLLKVDGSSCFKILPNVSESFYEASDFWFGNPDQAVQTVTTAAIPVSRPALLSVRQVNSTLAISLRYGESAVVSVFSTDGRELDRSTVRSGCRAAVSVPRGMYIVSAVTDRGRVTQTRVGVP
jgi:hypothetical protein